MTALIVDFLGGSLVGPIIVGGTPNHPLLPPLYNSLAGACTRLSPTAPHWVWQDSALHLTRVLTYWISCCQRTDRGLIDFSYTAITKRTTQG